MCVDFKDLIKSCLEDSYPLLVIDRLVESSTNHKILIFMDSFSGYNWTLMDPVEQEKISFIITKGTYYYKVMLFGLKNTRATY